MLTNNADRYAGIFTDSFGAFLAATEYFLQSKARNCIPAVAGLVVPSSTRLCENNSALLNKLANLHSRLAWQHERKWKIKHAILLQLALADFIRMNVVCGKVLLVDGFVSSYIRSAGNVMPGLAHTLPHDIGIVIQADRRFRLHWLGAVEQLHIRGNLSREFSGCQGAVARRSIEICHAKTGRFIATAHWVPGIKAQSLGAICQWLEQIVTSILCGHMRGEHANISMPSL